MFTVMPSLRNNSAARWAAAFFTLDGVFDARQSVLTLFFFVHLLPVW